MKNKLEKIENIFLVVVAIFIGLFLLGQATIFSNGDSEVGDVEILAEENHQEHEADEFYVGQVIEILSEERDDQRELIDQWLLVEITDGEREGDEIELENRAFFSSEDSQRFSQGDRIVLIDVGGSIGREHILIGDHYRLTGLIFIFLIFLSLVLYFGRKRGIGAILGLAFSMIVLIYYMIPNIIAGTNPIQVTLIGAVFISTVSLFLAHGINKRTPIIWASTVITLILAIIASHLFVDWANLFGRGSDLSTTFQMGQFEHINLRGLLLAGMVVGVLGVLSDVTSTQTTVIWQLKRANPEYGPKELYKSSLAVGREHIASLVNTLGLVYVGASLHLIILLRAADHVPLWVTINREPIAEELVRIIVGSTSLVLAVPISSFLAAHFISKLKSEEFTD